MGEFRVGEGLVHCFCRGCQGACETGLQQTNVFGLQAFEFHGGKGSAGKWKASVKAFPDGFPPDMIAFADEAPAGGAKGGAVKFWKDTSEGLGAWLERVCPEHPALARSRAKEN